MGPSDPVEPPANRKARALLAYLVRRPGQHAREALAGLLWPQVPAESGRRSLRVALSAVRKVLLERVRADRRFVAFEPQPGDTVDVEQLLQLDKHTELPTAEKLARVRELWRGEFLLGLEGIESEPFLEWLLLEREHVRQETLSLLHSLVQELAGEDDLRAARRALRMVLRLNPYEERAHRKLIENLARSGDLTRALAQFEACRELLRRELEVEPMPATVKLAERIGRLRERPRHNLPESPRPLLGRSDELEALGRILRGDNRLVTVFGPPGVGKTVLALEAARENAKHFLDGAAWVHLTPVEDSGRLAGVITHTLADLGAIRPLRGATDPRAHLLEELRQPELLLLLDNYEHLLPEVDLLLEILRQATSISVLVTSRVRLNLGWEEVLELDGLALPAEADGADWEGSGAGRLFLQVARQAKSELRPERLPREQVAELLRMTGGLPLAIELAASELRSRDLSQVLDALSSDAGALSSRRRDLPPRQRSLRAAFDSALRLLRAEDQRVFSRLSVFRGGFDLKAAEEVGLAGRDQVVRLVDAALVRRTQEPGSTRFDLHALLQSYAGARLREDRKEQSSTAARHRQFYAQLAEREGRDMLMGERQKAAREQMLQEWENVLRGWRTALATQGVETLHSYIIGIWLVYEQMGWYQEGLAFFAAADETLSRWQMEDPAARGLLGRIRVRLGWFRFRVGELVAAAEALRAGEELLEGWDQRGDEIGIGRATRGLTWILRGDYDKAAQLLQSTERLGRETDNIFVLAATRIYQMMNELARGDLEAAEQVVSDSLELTQTYGDRRMVALAHVYDGFLALLQGENGYRPRQAFLESLELSRSFGDPWIEVMSLHGLGCREVEAENWTAAERHFEEGLSISQDIGEVRGVCWCQNGLGWASLGAERLQQACRQFRRALHAGVEAGLLPEALAALAGITLVAGARGESSPRADRLSRILHDPALAELDRRWIGRSAQELDFPLQSTSFEPEVRAVLRRWGLTLGSAAAAAG